MLDINNKINKRNNDAQLLQHEVLAMLTDAQQTTSSVEDTVASLNRYGLNDHHINLPAAVNEASSILDNIRLRLEYSNKLKTVSCTRDLDFWIGVSSDIEHQMNEVQGIQSDTKNLQERLDDATHIAREAYRTLDQTDLIHEQNVRGYKALAAKEYAIKTLELDLYAIFNNSIVPKTDELIGEIKDNSEKVVANLNQLRDLKTFVNDANEECSSGLSSLKESGLPVRASQHAKQLMRQAKEYAKSFLNTKNGAEVALRAR